MRYILEVAVIVHDPSNEPVRIGSARYYIEQAELTRADLPWPFTGARGMTPSTPLVWRMPNIDGKPSGSIFIECTLTHAPDRKVPDA